MGAVFFLVTGWLGLCDVGEGGLDLVFMDWGCDGLGLGSLGFRWGGLWVQWGRVGPD